MDDWSDVAALFGPAATVEVVDVLRDAGRNRAARLRVGKGETVIAKRSLGDPERPFVYGDDTDGASFQRFCNEAAGCRLLGRLGFGPTLLASAPELGLFVMEDLGTGVTLAQRLLGDDGPAAIAALEAYVRTLARMHRSTLGGLFAWEAARQATGGKGARPIGDPAGWRRSVGAFETLCSRLDAPLTRTIDADFATIGAALDAPGHWLAFTPSDCCPDNNFLRGETVVFFDCEFATYRHALLDLAYVVAPFPTCWCRNRLPDGLAARLVELYRAELDGADFGDQLAFCAAYWTVTSLGWAASDPSGEDRTWGIATLRQRNRLGIDSFLSLGRAELLPALTRTLIALRDRLPGADPMPLYPALRH